MIEQFKNELKNLEYYKESLTKVSDSLSLNWYELTGVKGVQYDKQRGAFNKDIADKRKYYLLGKIEAQEQEKRRLQANVQYIEDVLSLIKDQEIREAIVNIYVHKKTFRKEAKKHYMSHVTLYNQINKQLKEALKKTYDL